MGTGTGAVEKKERIDGWKGRGWEGVRVSGRLGLRKRIICN